VSFDVLENTKIYYACHAHICMVTVVLLDTTWQSGHIFIQLYLYNDLAFEDVSPTVSQDSPYPYSKKLKKGKAVPLQAWSGPEGSRKLRFPDFMTMAQDGGKVVNLTHRPPLPPGNTPGTHFC